MLVDDMNEYMTPLLYCNIRVDISEHRSLCIELLANYFNLRNNLWEPFI